MTAPKRVVLCADDYGVDAGIDAAIDELLRARRLSAVSCLVGGACWVEHGAALAAHGEEVSVGLHLNLTWGRPLSAALARYWPRLPSLGTVLREAALRRLPSEAIAAELAAQWDRFCTVAGREPDHVDGHQHVHALPGVREVLVERLRARPWPPAVRSTAVVLGPGAHLKRAVLQLAGGRGLLRLLETGGLPHNTALAGAYDFGPGDFGTRMRAWLLALPHDGGWIFCHPGRPEALNDPIAAARRREAAYLGSDAFPRDLASAGFVLAPPSR